MEAKSAPEPMISPENGEICFLHNRKPKAAVDGIRNIAIRSSASVKMDTTDLRIRKIRSREISACSSVRPLAGERGRGAIFDLLSSERVDLRAEAECEMRVHGHFSQPCLSFEGI